MRVVVVVCLFCVGVSSAFVAFPSSKRPLISSKKGSSVATDESIDTNAWGVLKSEDGTYRFNVVDNSYSVDSIKCTIVKNPSLGLVLEELAANEEAGVVVIKDVVPDGPAAESPLKAGDVMSKVNGRNVEAKTYDNLVNVLVNADPVLEITAKRLLKRYQVKATVEYANGEKPTFETTFYADENLRRGLIARGVKVNDSQLGRSCGGDATCTTCAVQIIDDVGLTDLKPPEKIIFKDQKDGLWRLACQASIKDGGAFNQAQDQLKLRIYPHRQNK